MTNPYCAACGRAQAPDARYCADCGAAHFGEVPSSPQSSNYVETAGGDIAESFNVTGSFNINNFAANGSATPTEMRRTTVRKLPITEPSRWVTVLGVIGSLASIAGSFVAMTQHALPYWTSVAFIVLGMACFAVFILFGQLRKERYLSLGFIKNGPAKSALERGRDGGIYFTRIVADCPFCTTSRERMDLYNDENRDARLICKRNGKMHRLWFDHTQLPPLEDDRSSEPGGDARDLAA